MILKVKQLAKFLSRHKATEIVILVLITLVAAQYWFGDGIPKSDDFAGDIIITQAAWESIFDHHVLPEWSTQSYLGYPQFYVHPPVTHCLLMVSRLLLSWVDAAKLIFLLFFALSGVFAYWYVYELTNNRAASFVAGLSYTFIPYHIMEVVFEGHLGCLGLPYMLTPLVFLSTEKTIKNPSARKCILTGILLAILILTYAQVIPFLIGPFLALYMIFRVCFRPNDRHTREALIAACALIGCIGLLLSAFWWLPLLEQLDYSYNTEFALEDAGTYSATFRQALTLRPSGLSSCRSNAYSPSDPIASQLLYLFPSALALLGIIFNYKNKLVWFFVPAAALGIILAMGLDSPIKLFEFAHEHVPFFSGIRTPQRFLLFTSFAYIVLIGFAVKSIVNWLGHSSKYSVPVAILVSLVILGGTWQESREAFEIRELPSAQEQALQWLSEQDDGRVLAIPLDTWVHYPDARNMINPVSFTWLHEKEMVHGGTPALAPKWTGDFLDNKMHWGQEGAEQNVGEILDVLGIRYVVVDKTSASSSSYVWDDSLIPAWGTETVAIYWHEDPYPRVFATVTTHTEITEESDNWERIDGTQPSACVLKDYEHVKTGEYSWNSSYIFDESGHNWMTVGTDFSIHEKADKISFWYYLSQPIKDVTLSLGLLELDRSLYTCELVTDMSSGWHEVDMPLSFFLLRDSQDENMRLDKEQVDQIWLSVHETKEEETAHEFSIHFSPFSVSTSRMEQVDFSPVHPGKYQVHLDSQEPVDLILTESYYPGWVAKIDGQAIPSERTFGFLNGWHISETGDHEITLEFTPSNLRTVARLITLLSFVGILAFLVAQWITKREGVG